MTNHDNERAATPFAYNRYRRVLMDDQQLQLQQQQQQYQLLPSSLSTEYCYHYFELMNIPIDDSFEDEYRRYRPSTAAADTATTTTTTQSTTVATAATAGCRTMILSQPPSPPLVVLSKTTTANLHKNNNNHQAASPIKAVAARKNMFDESDDKKKVPVVDPTSWNMHDRPGSAKQARVVVSATCAVERHVTDNGVVDDNDDSGANVGNNGTAPSATTC
jgi:hypothetical protein